jgi:UDP-N-acetylglucosamine acyltransferase
MNKDIPPYTLAEGHPAVIRGLNVIGLVRAKFPASTRNALHKAYKTLFRSGLNTTQALEAIEKEQNGVPEIAYLCDFIRTSKRGISKERNTRE